MPPLAYHGAFTPCNRLSGLSTHVSCRGAVSDLHPPQQEWHPWKPSAETDQASTAMGLPGNSGTSTICSIPASAHWESGTIRIGRCGAVLHTRPPRCGYARAACTRRLWSTAPSSSQLASRSRQTGLDSKLRGEGPGSSGAHCALAVKTLPSSDRSLLC